MSPVIKVLRLRNFPILRQLYIEESLMRASSENWFIVNDGTPSPAVVMGISGKPEQLVYQEKVEASGVALIKRFTGGGTVVVDSNTVFTTLVMNAGDVPGLSPYPRQIMKWSEQVFAPVFGRYGRFALREHDYVFGDVKFGGNAQAISKDRFVHHTSLLWDYEPDRMAMLKHPAKTPEYRQDRAHHEFITPLKSHVDSRHVLLDLLEGCLVHAGFEPQGVTLEEVEAVVPRNRLIGTKVLVPGGYEPLDG